MKSSLLLNRKVVLKLVAACMLLAASAEASTNVFKFDADPSADLTIFRAGDNGTLASMAGAWISTNGSTLETGVVDQSTNGYLAITQTTPPAGISGAHGMRSGIIFDDFDGGLVIAGFTFTCDVRIGAGSDSPADGFSLNYARGNDPVIVNADGTGFACHPAGCGTEANLPEEGTQTGLSICFDAWNSGAPDVIGLTIRVDNIIITNVAMPTLNGACGDVTSLQTGPNTAGNDLSQLCWQPLFVQLTTSGLLNVSYKGNPFLTNFVVSFASSPGRLIFAGRTGGAWQEQDVDNIRIVTIPSTTPVVAQPFQANANGFRVLITDSGSSTPDTGTITLKLDGSSVTPSSITKNGAVTTVSYQNIGLVLASGSSHTGIIHFTGSTFSGSVDVTNTFTVPAYTMMTIADKSPGAVNTSLSGFAGRIHGLPIARDGTLNNYERQLAGGYIDPGTGLPYASYTTLTTFNDEVLNWGQDVSIGGAEVGNFTSTAAPPADWMDESIPGTDRSSYDPDNLAVELLAILDLPVGSYQLGVNHDDGFKFTMGPEPRDAFKRKLIGSSPDATDDTMNIVVTNAGKYPIRLVWGENTGGAQLEFYLVDFNTGNKILINNRTNPVEIASYRDTAALTQPYVRWVYPGPGDTGVSPNTTLIAKLDDGTAGTITDGTITLKLDGNGTATHPRVGGEVTATLASLGALASGSTHTAELVYNTSLGGPFTNTWTFTAATYQILPVSLRTAVGSGDASKPGFKVKTWLLDTNYLVNTFKYPADSIGSANDIYEADMLFTGLWGPNAADTSSFTDNGYYDETGTINYRSSNGGAFENPPVGANDAGSFTAANGHPDAPVPGITPSITVRYPNDGGGTAVDNYALTANAYIEFPAAGFYTMGVASDDGFEVTVGDSENMAGKLTITAPGPIARGYVFQPNDPNTDNVLDAGALRPNVKPVTARVILTDPSSAEAALNNSNAIKGNIAFFSRNAITNYGTGKGASAARVQRCQDAGAIAVIEYVAPGQFPFNIGSGTVSVPFAMLNFGDGTNILAYVTSDTNSPVFATFGSGDQAQALGMYIGGRGADPATTFGVYAPQPGLYPMRLLFEQGGGDASVEWWTQDSLNRRALVNESSPTNGAVALKAFRARTVSGGAPQITSIVKSGTNVNISWTGVGELQQAGSVSGPYYRTPGIQNNPQTIPATNTDVYFRVRQY